jgi:chaperonin GroES
MPLHPLGDTILLERIAESPSAPGRIVLAASAKEISQEAKVVATGPGRVTDQGMRIPMELRVGDRVLVRRYAGVEIEVEGQELILVRESEILGTIT